MSEQDAEYWNGRWRFAWEMVDKVGNDSIVAHMRVINLRTAIRNLIEEHRGGGPSIRNEFADGTVVETDDLVPQRDVPIERLEEILEADKSDGWSVDDASELRRKLEGLADWASGREAHMAAAWRENSDAYSEGQRDAYDEVERRVRSVMLGTRGLEDVALPDQEPGSGWIGA